MPFTDPRLSAHKIVRQCLTGPADLQEALDRELQHVGDVRDKSLTTEIVYGYLRFRGRIDYVNSLFLDKPEKLSTSLKILLGLAGYEIFFLDRVPHYAAVSKAVDLCSRLYGRKMSGLVNAVLRKAARVDIFSEDLFKKDNPGETVFRSRFFSCPEWIVKMWTKAYGRDLCLDYLRQSLDKPPPGLREVKGYHGTITDPRYLSRRIENCVLLKDGFPELDKCLTEGRFVRQSFAGQQAMFELGMKEWKQPVWDMCAGSGGKTFLMLDQGMKVYSSDTSLKRLKYLKRSATHYQNHVRMFAASGQSPALKVHPPTILIDAPCTGLGVLSRRPDIKWKRLSGDITALALIQAGLLKSAAMALNTGGIIIYLTCTLSKDENEKRVNDFLDEHDNFILKKMFQTDPGQGLKEFFFGAVLQKW